jgi:hypothetical protein
MEGVRPLRNLPGVTKKMTIFGKNKYCFNSNQIFFADWWDPTEGVRPLKNLPGVGEKITIFAKNKYWFNSNQIFLVTGGTLQQVLGHLKIYRVLPKK